MKRAIILVFLTVLWVSVGGVSLAPEGESSPGRFETFAEWCLHQDNLPPAAQHTVGVLLTEVETLDCTQADEQLVARTKLILDGREIRDVTPLASLTRLTDLGLTNNYILDVAPLARLTNLTTLAISANPLSDVAPLASLTNLQALLLRGNRIVKIATLARMTQMPELGLHDNQL